jgi:peptidyl-prolyl cis-trans isomerase C
VKRSLDLVLILAVSLVIGLGCSGKKSRDELSKTFPDSLVADELLVTVNDYPIRGQDLRIYSGLTGGSSTSAETVAEYNEDILEQFIRRILLWNEATARGVTETDSTVNALYLEFARSVGGEEAFVAQLSQVQIKKEEVLQSIKRDLVIRNFMVDYFSPQVQINEADAEAYFNLNVAQFRTPDEVSARHILLQVGPNDNEVIRQEKSNRIEQILAEAKQGGDFAALAGQYSEGPSKSQGGDLGYFRQGAMVQPFDSVAFSLKVGEISDVVETRFGFHIIKLEDKRLGVQQSYEAIKDSLMYTMRQIKLGETIQNHLNEMYNLAIIKRNY